MLRVLLVSLRFRLRVLLLASLFFSSFPFAFGQVVQWPVAGQGAANLRSQPAESFLGTSNAASLIPKWIFTTEGDVSATPTVGGSTVFVPDWAGYLFAIDLATGEQIWSHPISEYDGYAARLRVSVRRCTRIPSLLATRRASARLTVGPT